MSDRTEGVCAAGSFVHFIESTHVDGLAPIGFDLLHYVAVGIINECGGLPADCYRGQAVFGIEGLGVGLPTNDVSYCIFTHRLVVE